MILSFFVRSITSHDAAVDQTFIESIKNMMESMHLDIQTCMDTLKIPENKCKEYEEAVLLS